MTGIGFSERLKYLRKKAGLSQEKLEDISGVSKTSIGRYERGIRLPKLSTAKLMADALGVEVETLVKNGKG